MIEFLSFITMTLMMVIPMTVVIHVMEADCKLTYLDNVLGDFRTATVGQLMVVILLLIFPILNIFLGLVFIAYTLGTRIFPYTPKEIMEKIRLYNQRCARIELEKKEGRYPSE